MYTIKKRFDFSASHVLACLAPEHPCSRMHGHNYQIILELKSDSLNEAGFVKDYRELDMFKQWVDTELDHRHLNDVFEVNPSAENMAASIYHLWKHAFPQLSAVIVKETEKTEARYEPDFD